MEEIDDFIAGWVSGVAGLLTSLPSASRSTAVSDGITAGHVTKTSLNCSLYEQESGRVTTG